MHIDLPLDVGLLNCFSLGDNEHHHLLFRHLYEKVPVTLRSMILHYFVDMKCQQ